MPEHTFNRLETELTAARLAVNDWHACASHDELERWRRAQVRLIDAAKAVGAREANSDSDLLAGLKVAVETISVWHSYGADDIADWDRYRETAPEMQTINAAIAKVEGR